jgi:hypothetical protein
LKSKYCTACKDEHPLSAFGKHKGKAHGLRSSCKKANAEAQKKRAREASTPDLIHVKEWAAYGTPMQRASAEALIACGNVPDAAASVQLSVMAFRGHLSELERAAARRGWLPGGAQETTPVGFSVKGTSTYYDADGNRRGQWVKTHADQDQQITRMLEALAGIAEPFKGASDPVATPAHSDDDLLCVYPFGDPHLGMHAWHRETGENFDIEIAERELVRAVDLLVDLAPPAKTAIIAPLGDMFHADNEKSTTTAGTPVDSDTRWPKIFGVGVRAMRRNIDRALEKHEHVIVKVVRGNHDNLSSMALAVCLANFYEREPRVTVDTSPSQFLWHRFGANLLGFNHGDKTKAKDLPGVMAVDRAKDWGETTFRYFYCGHVHHETVKEHMNVVIETFRTLAPKDAWHAGAGYRAMQDMRLHVIHREFGRINEHHVGIAQVRGVKR